MERYPREILHYKFPGFYRTRIIYVFTWSSHYTPAEYSPCQHLISPLILSSLYEQSPASYFQRLWLESCTDQPLLAKHAVRITLNAKLCPTERETIRTWVMDHHHRIWRDVPWHKRGRLFISGPCKKRTEDLLKLSRHQLRTVVAILTGHAPVRTQLRTMGLFEGNLPADSADSRLKQCSTSFVSARRWLAGALMSLGIRLSKLNMYV
jgi:hypothetical protein